jgi:type II secretory pathway component HofQ
MPTLPLTQLDERAPSADLDRRTVTLTFAQPVPIQELLLLLVRGTNLSIVPDPAIAGSFIGELKQVTVRQALGLTLPPLGLDYGVDGSFVRVFRREPETRIYDLNYIAVERVATSTVGGPGGGQTNAVVSSTTKGDLFADLGNGVRSLLSEHATFNVDRKAGVLQVTDFPERLDRVGVYLDAVQDRVHRQAQIDARVIEVELNDERAEGIDWSLVAAQLTGGPAGGQRPPRPSLTGLRVTDVKRLLELLAAQGKVATVATPRLLALNNEPAIVRTDAVTFSVTPQIAGDSVVTLSLSPIVKAPTPAESDMLARVADGETLVVSGFTRARDSRERKAVGLTGGWFGRATVVTRRHLELVVLLTPRIVPGVMAQ